MLKVIIDGVKKQKSVVFKKGDFFLTDTNSLRRIIQNGRSQYQVLNVQSGHIVSVAGAFDTADELVKCYVRDYGEIEKVDIEQITAKRTGEVLN